MSAQQQFLTLFCVVCISSHDHCLVSLSVYRKNNQFLLASHILRDVTHGAGFGRAEKVPLRFQHSSCFLTILFTYYPVAFYIVITSCAL